MVHDMSLKEVDSLDCINHNVQTRNSLEEPETPSKLAQAKFLAHKVKVTAHKLLEDNTNIDAEIDEDDIFDDVAYNPQKVLQDNQVARGSVRNRLHRGAEAVADAAKNPRKALTNTFTRKAANKVSRRHHDGAAEYDEALIDADDDLQRAISASNPVSQEDYSNEWDSDVNDAQQKVDRIKEQRESLRSAWILGRHVKRVKRVKIVQPLTVPPTRAQFLGEKTPGHSPQTQWLPYIGHLALWHTRSFTARHIDDYDKPPFDLVELGSTVERLAVISTPWQSFVIEIRNIYMWADPNRTLRWMTVYWVLWYYQYMISFVIGWAICSTINSKLRPADLQTIRERARRTQDHATQAQAWSELIRRHGRQDWVEPLIDQAGPLVQLQLADTANFLEILQNFYRWERPDKTLATLFYFGCCFLICTFTSMEVCVKLVWLNVGCMFFFGFPIATHYPKYRHIVNPVYWVFLDIPSTADLAIIQLQEKAVVKDAKELDRVLSKPESVEDMDGTDSELSDTSSEYHDLHPTPTIPHSSINTPSVEALTTIRAAQSLTFRAVLLATHTHSRLTLTRTGFWLSNKHQKRFHPYHTLVEIQKFDFDTKSSSNNYPKTPRRTSAQIQDSFKKLRTLQYVPTGLSFVFPAEPALDEITRIQSNTMTHEEDRRTETDRPNREELSLIVSESDRDKIFSVVLSWSNMKWQPLYSMDRRNLMGSTGDSGGNENRNLDDAIKKLVKSI